MALHVLRCAGYSLLGALRRRPDAPPFSDAVTPVWVPLRTVDAFLHVNNAKYLEFFEFARWERGVRHGMLANMLRTRYIEVVGTAHVQYVAQMSPLRMVHVKSEFIGIHGKAVLLQQTLQDPQPHPKTGQPKVYAVAVFKMTYLAPGGKPVGFKDVCDLFGCPDEYERIDAASREVEGDTVGTGGSATSATTAGAKGGRLQRHLVAMNESDEAWRARLRPPAKLKPKQ